jgi:hypothetical protein
MSTTKTMNPSAARRPCGMSRKSSIISQNFPFHSSASHSFVICQPVGNETAN